MSESLTLLGVAAAALFLLCLGLLFALSKSRRDVAELTQDLNKNIQDFNQLAEKFDLLGSLKQQTDQQLVKSQTQAESLTLRLGERDEKIAFLETELNEQQARNETLVQQVNHGKEQYGIAATQAQSLQTQLSQQQQRLVEKETEQKNLTEKLTALSQELVLVQTTLAEKEKHFAQQQRDIEQSKQQLSIEFQNLANRILDEKSRTFSQTHQSALETLLKPFREQIEGFQKRVNDIHSESLKGNAGLAAEIKKVLDVGLAMSQEANNLTSALKGEKKLLGNWGEMQLERALQLAGLEKDQHYQAQAHFKNDEGKAQYPDFVVHLPDGKHLIIDSKMSLVAYENAVNADNDAQAATHFQAHLAALKNHINELARKDYSRLINIKSPDFVLMFIALEPAYIDALKQDPTLFGYGYDRNVILVSHTTLMPILRTVANLWRIERGNAEAREIADKAGDIYNQVCLVAERLAKLGNGLSGVNKSFNDTVTALVGQQGLAGKTERFKTLSAKAAKTLPQLDPIYQEPDTIRLTAVFDGEK